jgi:nucleoside-diphosphate-sugar epimerase
VRIAVLGATGNVGTSVLRALGEDPAVESVLAIARREPTLRLPKTAWVVADVRSSNLVEQLRGAQAVVHLAWLIQPSRRQDLLRDVNVEGSRRVFEAVAEAEVPALVYASSVGAYSPGPKDRKVDESWPIGGIDSSYYSRHKSEVERVLDGFEGRHPEVRVVRLRPGLIFKREAGSEIRRYFAGPLLPRRLVQPRLLPLVPAIPRLRFQAVHADDVGEAYRLAATLDVRGAFNIAAEPVLDSPELGRLLKARPLRIPAGILRGAAGISWRFRLQPTAPGWIDMALAVPLMDSRRAREELGWMPTRSSGDALLELLAGIREGAGLDTPPLSPGAGGRFRHRELATAIGSSETGAPN